MFTIEDILEDVSDALMQPFVEVALTDRVAGVPEPQPIPSDPSMYDGALAVIGYGATVEPIVITAVPGGFVARFRHPHEAGEVIHAATFPVGLPEKQLFTQAEMLGYISEVQNDFLLRTQCYVTHQAVNYDAQERYYSQPDVTIRLERITAGEYPLFNDSQTDIDFGSPRWMADTGPIPKRWFQDKINIARYGFHPLPSAGGAVELLYSARGAALCGIADRLLVPAPTAHLLKYGTLARAWAKEGETRDLARSEYCSKRFDFGVALVCRFMGATQASLSGQSNIPKYNPLVVGQNSGGGGNAG